MRTLAIYLLALTGLAACEHKRGDDGFIRTYAGYGIWPWSRVYPIQTIGYPQESPDRVEHLWRYLPATNESAALKVTCYDFQLPQGGPCLEIEDNGERQLCGHLKPFSFVSDSRDITMKLNIELGAGVRLNCTIEAIYLDENRQELTTTTTTTPKPVELTYLKEETEEIDSSEDGGAPGSRTTTCPCGWANKVISRIVNGTETLPNEFPFTAGLVETSTMGQFCGAVIISSYHALTATHCTIQYVKENRPLSIVIGQHNRNDGPDAKYSQVVDVEHVIEHEGYAPGRYIDDISLLVLKSRIIFSARVGPACLPTKQLDLRKQYVKIIGWGAYYFMGPGVAALRKVNVRVVDSRECNRVYSQVKVTNATHLCTYATKKAACQGDSGGPVVWLDPETNRYTLVGLVSFGRVCGDKSPSVHTDVGAYLDWINHFVAESKRPSRMCYKKE